MFPYYQAPLRSRAIRRLVLKIVSEYKRILITFISLLSCFHSLLFNVLFLIYILFNCRTTYCCSNSPTYLSGAGATKYSSNWSREATSHQNPSTGNNHYINEYFHAQATSKYVCQKIRVLANINQIERLFEKLLFFSPILIFLYPRYSPLQIYRTGADVSYRCSYNYISFICQSGSY
jgi:hypothetical protein